MSSTKKVFFGTVDVIGGLQMVPAPLAGMKADIVSHIELLDFLDGGAGVSKSGGSHREFTMSFLDQPANLDVFEDYLRGEYGDGLIYFVDPFITGNILPPNWASPSLIESSGGDWPSLYDDNESFLATPGNIYSQPARCVNYNITTPPGTIPLAQITLVVPPLDTLDIGFSGSVVGDAKLMYQLHRVDGTAVAAAAMTLLDPTANVRQNLSVNGATYNAVTFYIQRSTFLTSNITIVSGKATLRLTTAASVLTGNHARGKGNSGLRFSTGISETYYTSAGTGRKDMSFSMSEVGLWELS